MKVITQCETRVLKRENLFSIKYLMKFNVLIGEFGAEVLKDLIGEDFV